MKLNIVVGEPLASAQARMQEHARKITAKHLTILNMRSRSRLAAFKSSFY